MRDMTTVSVDYVDNLRDVNSWGGDHFAPLTYTTQMTFEVEHLGSDLELLDSKLWAWLNAGSGRERWDLLDGRRSLSVGDRVTLSRRVDGTVEVKTYECASFGWELVT